MANIVEQAVAATGMLVEFVHGLLHDAGHLLVIGIGGFPGLEEHVRVLGSTPYHRMVRIQRAVFVRHDLLFGHHRLDDVIRDGIDLRNFVRCPEPVKNVQEGHPRFQGGHL